MFVWWFVVVVLLGVCDVCDVWLCGVFVCCVDWVWCMVVCVYVGLCM